MLMRGLMGIMGTFNCESLELRRLFSVTLANGLLQVSGTAGDDVIYLSVAPNASLSVPFPAQIAVNINKQRAVFDLALITRIQILGLAGDDEIFVSGPDPSRPFVGLREFPRPVFIN